MLAQANIYPRRQPDAAARVSVRTVVGLIFVPMLAVGFGLLVSRFGPYFPYPHYRRAGAWLEKKEYAKAIAEYSEAIRLDPKFAYALCGRGLARLEQKKYDMAIADFDEAIRVDPRSSDAYYDRAVAWSEKTEYDNAIADYNEAIRLDPSSYYAYYGRAGVWSKKLDYDRAISDYNEFIRLNPWVTQAFRDWPELFKDDWAQPLLSMVAVVYFERGLAWLGKKEYAKALADYSEAIRFDPEMFSAYNGRAEILAACPDPNLRDGRKAIELATKACELTKWNDAGSLAALAAAHAEVGEFNLAMRWQTKANALYADTESKARGGTRLKLYQDMKPYRERGVR